MASSLSSLVFAVLIATCSGNAVQSKVTGVQAMLEMVEELARQETEPTPDVIKKISDWAGQMEVALKEEHKWHTKEQEEKVSDVNKCNDVHNYNLTNIDANFAKPAQQAGKDHLQCRVTESEFFKTALNNKCGDDSVPQAGTLRKTLTDADVSESCVFSGNEKDEKSMMDCLARQNQHLCVLNQEKKVSDGVNGCTDARKTTNDQRDKCNMEQHAYEAKFCQWSQEMHDTCRHHATCYESAKLAYMNHQKDLDNLIPRWTQDFVGIKRISCFTGVWNTKDSATMKATKESCDKPVCSQTVTTNCINTAEVSLARCPESSRFTTATAMCPGSMAACSLADVDPSPADTTRFNDVHYKTVDKDSSPVDTNQKMCMPS